MMGNARLAVLVASLLALGACARVTDGAATATRTEPADTTWSYSVAVYLYLVPDDDDYAQPTFNADRRWLHLEARYNYEDLETGSAWVGYNMRTGDEISFEFTPELGIVFGQTTGWAPGYHGLLAWKRLALYSEGEYVFDADNSEDSFFYSWSEATVSPADRLRTGLALQRRCTKPRASSSGEFCSARLSGDSRPRRTYSIPTTPTVRTLSR